MHGDLAPTLPNLPLSSCSSNARTHAAKLFIAADTPSGGEV